MLNKRLFIVFGIDHYNLLGVVRSLGMAGINPVVIVMNNRVVLTTESRYVNKAYRVDTVEEGYQILLSEFGNCEFSPFVITCDDKTMGYIDAHYEEMKNKFIFFNAGRIGRITEYMDKNRILEIAKKYGLHILDTVVVDRGTVPKDLEYPIITKSISPIIGGWKSDVHICKNEDELEKAFKLIKSPKVLIQKYIEKKNEYCLDGFTSSHGKNFFVSIASKYKYLIPGYYSPYYDVLDFNDLQLENSLRGMMREIGFDGIFSIEFLIDQDDTLYFSEVNFRNSTWSYASTCVGMNLPFLWAKSMLTGKVDESWKVPVPKGFTAMVEPIDYAKRVLSGKLSLFEWLIDFKNTNCTHYLTQDDMKPYYVMVNNIDLLS